MDQAKTLLRTAVRTFFNNPKQVLIIDALLLHSILHIDDLTILLSSQAKDIRALINPLRATRLLATHQKPEVRVGSSRITPREYYYIPFHPAIDAIKYRIVKLRRKVENLYQQDETKKKDWRCPRCKAEYEQMEILDRRSDDGFYCERCGAELEQNEEVAQDRHNHAKIRHLNIQLAKFDELIARVDRVVVPENNWLEAEARRHVVPRPQGSGFADKPAYLDLQREDKNASRMNAKRQEVVDSKNLAVSLTDTAAREKEIEEAKERRKKELAKQNSMPSWHTGSAIGRGSAATEDADSASGVADLLKKEEEREEKKINVEEDNIQDEVAAYMAEMERERIERERKEQEESDEEDEEDFEDVEFAATPSGSQLPVPTIKFDHANGDRELTNGLKREFDPDGGSSGITSEANTPAAFGAEERESKRVKFEIGNLTSNARSAGSNGNGMAPAKKEEDDSEEDEDFEDAM